MRFTPSAVATLVSLSMAVGGSAFAQGNSDRRDRGGDEGRNAERSQNHGQGHGNRNDHQRQRGAGPDHSFYKGDRLPREYHDQRYVVSDWRGRHLSAPPRGYHWVQSGNDYLLVAIATGVILSLILNH